MQRKRSVYLCKGLLDSLSASNLWMHKGEFVRAMQTNDKKNTELTQNWDTFEFPPNRVRRSCLIHGAFIQQRTQKAHGLAVGLIQAYSKSYYRPALINLQDKPQKELANPQITVRRRKNPNSLKQCKTKMSSIQTKINSHKSQLISYKPTMNN